MSRELFLYKNNQLNNQPCYQLHFGSKPSNLVDIVKNYENPIWLYDLELVQERIGWIKAWPKLGQLHYAMKANFHPEILKLMQKNNCGVDVVSIGEIRQALQCGFKPSDIIFSGVGKTESELSWSIEHQIYQINTESLSEIKKIIKLSESKKQKVDIGIRVNPEVDPETHPYIATSLQDSKFGMDFGSTEEAVQLLKGHLYVKLKSISFHLGSQIMNLDVYKKALQAVKPFYLKIKSVCPELDRLDLGGGLGIDYKDHDINKDQKRWQELTEIYDSELKDFPAYILLELGRFMVARCAVLLCRVEVIKETPYKNFLILDAGMSLLMRPALYQAHHEVKPLVIKTMDSKNQELVRYDVVGPICESSDIFHKDLLLPKINEGDFVALCDAGAYGAAMSSRYNLRESAAEVFLS